MSRTLEVVSEAGGREGGDGSVGLFDGVVLL